MMMMLHQMLRRRWRLRRAGRMQASWWTAAVRWRPRSTTTTWPRQTGRWRSARTGIQTIGQGFLQGRRCGRLSVVHVGGRGWWTGRTGWTGAVWLMAGIGPRTDVRWAAVEALECSVIAGLGEQFETDGGLAFPFGAGVWEGEEKQGKKRTDEILTLTQF